MCECDVFRIAETHKDLVGEIDLEIAANCLGNIDPNKRGNLLIII
jgi:hypothetical protein